MTSQFSSAGLLLGVLVGLTGMGGGSLMTPILIGIVLVLSAVCAHCLNAWLARPRPAAARSFD